MAKREKDKPMIDADEAWDMFATTGNISYYLLYNRLNKKD
jgi:hypothetical protein